MKNPSMIFINGNVPSLKNSKQMIPGRISKYGKKIPPRLIHSKTVSKYLKVYEVLWKLKRMEFVKAIKKAGLEYPYHIGFHFVRDSKRRYDFINALQLAQDLMVKHDWIEDDNVDFLFPYPFEMNGEYTSYNKENPGVWIKLDINIK